MNSEDQAFLAEQYRTLGDLRSREILQRAAALHEIMAPDSDWTYRAKYHLERATAETSAEIASLECEIVALKVELGLDTYELP